MATKIHTPRMVVTRTPLRVSLAGGGTDLPSFYESDYGGVLSTTINQYIYVTVKQHGEIFEERIRLNYSKSEQVQTAEQIENNIARECLKFLSIKSPIYVSTVGDLPASTGLGGSSSFTVGLLNALHTFRGQRVSAAQLAEEASFIEISTLQEPIGKQDQYAAAFGGLNCFFFKSGGSVTIEPLHLSNGRLHQLFDQLLLFWTGDQRDASSVLAEQSANTPEKMPSLIAMRDLVFQLRDALTNGTLNIQTVGHFLHNGWKLKRDLASSISNARIERLYKKALGAGAIGGKLCGAGGGGFLLFVVPKTHQKSVQRALTDLTHVEIKPESHGSQVVLVEE